MRFFQAIALGLTFLVSAPAFAQSPRDRTALLENPVGSIYQGKVTYPDYKRAGRNVNNYRTRINAGISSGPNFAGEYAITTFGCGTSCAMGYLSDVTSGHVSELPFGGEDMPNLNLVYNIRSAAVVVYWQPNERCMRQVAVLEADSFKLAKPEDLGGREVCEAAQ